VYGWWIRGGRLFSADMIGTWGEEEEASAASVGLGAGRAKGALAGCTGHTLSHRCAVSPEDLLPADELSLPDLPPVLCGDGPTP